MSTLIKTNGPRKAFSPLRNLMDRFWDADSIFDREELAKVFMQKDWIPAVNIKEDPKKFEIEVAAPGLEKDDFEVSVDNGILSIKAEKEENIEEKETDYTRREFSYHKFHRSFTLPENIDEHSIVAKYNNGVLMINLKKSAAHKVAPKKINIK